MIMLCCGKLIHHHHQMDDRGKLSLYDSNGNLKWNRMYLDHITIYPGSYIAMKDGDSLWSKNGKYQFVQQTDGNAVVYEHYDDDVDAIWNAETGGKTGAKFIAQSDGNLVVYFQSEAIWNIGYAQNSQSNRYKLYMQNDGNLVYYDCNGIWVWASKQNYLNPDYTISTCDDQDLVEPNNSISICLFTTTSTYPMNGNNNSNVIVIIGSTIAVIVVGGGILLCFILYMRCKRKKNAVTFNFLIMNANQEGL